MLFTDVIGATAQQEIVCRSVLSWFDKTFLKEYEYDVTIEHLFLSEDSAIMYVSGELEDPREFTIEIHHYLNGKEYIMTLIHEMIHIEDYIKGNLTEQDGKRYWNGVFYESDDYDNQPWEIRANQLEEVFCDLYCRTLG
jgi:hypothetical protein